MFPIQTRVLLPGFTCMALLSCGQSTNQVVKIEQPTPAPIIMPMASSKPNQVPVIQVLSANPSHEVKAGESISLNVKVFDADGDTLDYTWKASKGLLSATKGTLINWSPIKMDTRPEEPGIAIISLLVSDNQGGSDKADVNILIATDGSAHIQSGLITEGEK